MSGKNNTTIPGEHGLAGATNTDVIEVANDDQVGLTPEQLYKKGCEDNIRAMASVVIGNKGEVASAKQETEKILKRVQNSSSRDGASYASDLRKDSSKAEGKNTDGQVATSVAAPGGKSYCRMDGKNVKAQASVSNDDGGWWCIVM